jgi:archaellum component FlaC
MATQYYDEVLKILTQMKEEHISDLIEEKEKYLQISDIQVDYLNENVEEIIYMR